MQDKHNLCIQIFLLFLFGLVGRESRNGLNGPGIGSWWDEIFYASPDRPRGTPTLPFKGYPLFTGDKAAGARCWVCEWLVVIPLPPLYAFIGMSLCDLYLYSENVLIIKIVVITYYPTVHIFCEELGLDFSGLNRDKLQAVATTVINISGVVKWKEFLD